MALGKQRVLVVEDDEVDIKTIQRAFARQGMAEALQFARDGQEAWECLKETGQPPKLMLLDQNMPRLSGLELLEKMRDEPRFKETPVIMITTSRNAVERAKAERLGVAAYFVKEDLAPDYKGLFEVLESIQGS